MPLLSTDLTASANWPDNFMNCLQRNVKYVTNVELPNQLKKQSHRPEWHREFHWVG